MPPQMHQQDRYRGRGDAGYPGGLPQRCRANLASFWRTSLESALRTRVVQVLRQRQILVAARLLDLMARALDVAGVAGLHLQVQPNLGRQPAIQVRRRIASAASSSISAS